METAVRNRRARLPGGALPAGASGDEKGGHQEGHEPSASAGAVRQLLARVRKTLLFSFVVPKCWLPVRMTRKMIRDVLEAIRHAQWNPFYNIQQDEHPLNDNRYLVRTNNTWCNI